MSSSSAGRPGSQSGSPDEGEQASAPICPAAQSPVQGPGACGGATGAQAPPRRQVRMGCQQCGKDLQGLKRFYRRYRACESCALAPHVDRGGGSLQRFCQQCGRFHPLDSFKGLMRTCKVQLARHAERQRQRRMQKRAAPGPAAAAAGDSPAPSWPPSSAGKRSSEAVSAGDGAASGAFKPLQPRAVRARREPPPEVAQEPLLLLTAAEALAAPQAAGAQGPDTPRPAQAQLLAEWSAALDGSGTLKPWQPADAALLPQASAGFAAPPDVAALLQSGAMQLWGQQQQQQQQQQQLWGAAASQATQVCQALGLDEHQLYWLGRLAQLLAAVRREEGQRAAAAAAASLLQQPLWA